MGVILILSGFFIGLSIFAIVYLINLRLKRIEELIDEKLTVKKNQQTF